MSINFNLIQDSFNKYIVRPSNAFGLGGFIFDVEGDATVNLTAEITDHYTEDNSAIQDHIAVRPKRVTLHQYVGELVYRLDGSTNTPLQKTVQKLTVLSSYLPTLSKAASQAKSIFEGGLSKSAFNNLTSVSLQDAADLWSLVKNLTPPTTRQAQAYMYFKALMEQKILVSIETPFEFMANMAIETITANQSEDTKYISDFAITLKQMRFASTKTIAFDESKYQSRLKTQQSDVSTGGKLQGQTVRLNPSPIPQPFKVGASGGTLPPSVSLFNLPDVSVAPVNQKPLSIQDGKNLGISKTALPSVPGIN